MIWIDDLVLLEPNVIRHGLQLDVNQIGPDRFALALRDCRPATRAHVLENLEPDFASRVREAMESSSWDRESVFAAQMELIALCLWPIVYRKFPEEYDRFSECQQYRLERLFPPHLYANMTLLDIGCGTGRLVGHLSGAAARIYAVDPVKAMLRMAERKYEARGNVDFAIGSFSDIPLQDNSVDFIVSNMAFQYDEFYGGRAGIRNMLRVLRPGGTIRLTVGNTLTQSFLLANGFAEEFVPLGLHQGPIPDDASPLLRWLFALAKRGSSGSAEPARSPHHYRCAATGWRLKWTISNIIAVVRGTPWRSAFHGGRLSAPLGMPVYELVKGS